MPQPRFDNALCGALFLFFTVNSGSIYNAFTMKFFANIVYISSMNLDMMQVIVSFSVNYIGTFFLWVLVLTSNHLALSAINHKA